MLSVIGGFVGMPEWMYPGANKFSEFLEPSLAHTHIEEHALHPHSTEILFALLSVLVAVIAIYIAYRMYVRNPEKADALATRLRLIHRLLFRKYYVDELYDATVIKPTVWTSTKILWKGFDVGLIDGAVNGSGRTIQGFGSILKGIQNGLIRNYAVWILLGAAALLCYLSIFRG